MTRYAAVSMLISVLVAQFDYMPFDKQLFGAALCGWYAVIGAGPLAIDSLLRRGLADSALLLVPRIVLASEWVRSNCGPFFVSLMRIWFGAALLLPAMRPLWAPTDHSLRLSHWLPVGTTVQLPATFALIGGGFLVLGFGTRYMAVAPRLDAAAMQPGGSAYDGRRVLADNVRDFRHLRRR